MHCPDRYVYFVGAGSGAPDLITVRGARLLNQADQIIYAGSLVNPELLDYKKESAVVYDSAKMTLEEVVEKIQEAESTGKMTVRLHTGDPCVYGAIREQMDELDKLNISYKFRRKSWRLPCLPCLSYVPYLPGIPESASVKASAQSR